MPEKPRQQTIYKHIAVPQPTCSRVDGREFHRPAGRGHRVRECRAFTIANNTPESITFARFGSALLQTCEALRDG